MDRKTQVDLALAATEVTDYYFGSDSGIDWDVLDELMKRLEAIATRANGELYREN